MGSTPYCLSDNTTLCSCMVGNLSEYDCIKHCTDQGKNLLTCGSDGSSDVCICEGDEPADGDDTVIPDGDETTDGDQSLPDGDLNVNDNNDDEDDDDDRGSKATGAGCSSSSSSASAVFIIMLMAVGIIRRRAF